MIKEIGSEFCISDFDNNKENDLSWISKYGYFILTSSGRGAISLMIQKIKPKIKTVLLPIYICESVIIPFRDEGYELYFYDVDKSLSPVIESIKTKDVGVFIHMGYYGFGTNLKLKNIISKLKSQSTIVVEDVTHTLFSEFTRGVASDYYVASIRKWFGLPGGGFLASNNKITCDLNEDNIITNIRKKAFSLKYEYINNNNKDEEVKLNYLKLFEIAEELLDKNSNSYKMDNLSKMIIKKIDIAELLQNRRANFNRLSDTIKDIDYLTPVFSENLYDVCPLFYPIWINEKRDEVRKKLIREKIYCPIHWPMSNFIKKYESNNVSNLYHTILSIPCDQRYNKFDMDRVICVLKSIK